MTLNGDNHSASRHAQHGEHIRLGGDVQGFRGEWNFQILYEDGATARSGDGVRYQFTEPDDPIEILRNRVRYYALKLHREQKAHDDFLHYCQQQADHHLKGPMYCPPPPADWKDQLARGKERITALTKTFQELDAELQQTDPELIIRRQHREIYEAGDAQRRKLFEETLLAGGIPVSGGGLSGPSPL